MLPLDVIPHLRTLSVPIWPINLVKSSSVTLKFGLDVRPGEPPMMVLEWALHPNAKFMLPLDTMP